jgi:nucleoside 2-deoxyribosyltransferase
VSRPSTYLAGPIAGCSYAGATDWRLSAQSDLARLGITAFSPLRCKTHLSGVAVLDSGHNPEHPLCSPEAIFARDRFDVERVDALFVNLLGATHVSIGTVMEIAWAHVWRKPVVVVMEPSGNVHDGHAMLMQCLAFRTDNVTTGLELLAAILLPDAQRESVSILNAGPVQALADATCDLHEVVARLATEATNYSEDKLELLNRAGPKLRAVREQLGMEIHHE